MRRDSVRRPSQRGSLGLLVAIAACALVVPVEGPSPPATPTISRIVITSVESGERKSRAIGDPARIRAILASYAFSMNGWIQTDARRLVPVYRIDFHSEERVASVYWLGTNSHPPEFPCYALCTGWWLAASGPSGDLDRTRYKLLPESVSLFLLRDLELP